MDAAAPHWLTRLILTDPPCFSLITPFSPCSGAVIASVRALIESASVLVDRLAAEAGLAVLESGGDFADGVIAFEGRRAGGPVFVSFD